MAFIGILILLFLLWLFIRLARMGIDFIPSGPFSSGNDWGGWSGGGGSSRGGGFSGGGGSRMRGGGGSGRSGRGN
jgi:uncharacterized membrane protein YgcG